MMRRNLLPPAPASFLSLYRQAGIVVLICPLFLTGYLAGQQTNQTGDSGTTASDEQQLFATSFDAESNAWEMTDADAWKFEEGRLKLFKKQSSYSPPHRSPRHIAWLKEKKFESFQLDVKVLSTHEDYNHRDTCLFFGYQDASRFYYVHLGKATDPHANQIFIVNNAARTKISLTTTEGTPWDENWHSVRIERDVDSGDIRVYFNDMENPAMTANDKTFAAGQIGLGSFDDTADFDDLTIQKLDR